MLCSHSNAGTLVLCTGSCIIHSWESNYEKTGKSYTILVLRGNLLFPSPSDCTLWGDSACLDTFNILAVLLTANRRGVLVVSYYHSLPDKKHLRVLFSLYWYPPFTLPFNQCTVNQWYIRNTDAWSYWKYAAEKYASFQEQPNLGFIWHNELKERGMWVYFL